jgi:hypothetical protein
MMSETIDESVHIDAAHLCALHVCVKVRLRPRRHWRAGSASLGEVERDPQRPKGAPGSNQGQMM